MNSKVTLTGHFTLLDGTPAVGTVLIRPSRSPILDLDGKTVIAGPQRFTLDAEGRFSVGLPPTDDPALGEPFTYHVMVSMHHTNWQVIGLTLPADVTAVDVLDPPAGVVKEYPTRAEWDALTSAAVAEMETALDGAESARDTAVSARDNAVVARDETLTARDVTFTARDTAVDAAAETVTARTETLPARDEALAARDVTVEARDATLTARTETITALAGKVTGQGMALRYDTTVGERVFLDHPGGSTMLYGDTGWRNVSGSLRSDWVGGFYIRRVNDVLYLRTYYLREGTSEPLITLPQGFEPDVVSGYAIGFPPANTTVSYSPVSRQLSLPVGTHFGAGHHSTSVAMKSGRPWPTVLPGTPD